MPCSTRLGGDRRPLHAQLRALPPVVRRRPRRLAAHARRPGPIRPGPRRRPAAPRRGRRRRRGPPPRRPARRPGRRAPPRPAPRPRRRAPARTRPPTHDTRRRRRWCARPPTAAGGGRRRPPGPPPAATAGACLGRGFGLASDTRDSPVSGATMTSSSSSPATVASNAPVSVTSAQAIGQWSMCSSWWERCRRNPSRPAGRRPGGPGSASPARPRRRGPAPPPPARAMPATRWSCSATRAALSRRCAASSTCWKSQPPQRPGPAYGQGGSTRSGEARRISVASARMNDDVVEVTPRNHPFPGQRVTHEDDPPVGGVRHAPATAGDVAHLQLQELAVGCARHGANTT